MVPKTKPPGHAHRRADLDAVAQMDTNRPKAAKSRHENTENARAKDADAWAPVHVAVEVGIVARQVAMVEQLPGYESSPPGQRSRWTQCPEIQQTLITRQRAA